MIYIIKKGKHYSASWLGMLWRGITGWQRSTDICAKVTFSKECLTMPPQPGDINKLFGIGFGFDHHKDSIRVGWNTDGKKIILWSYVYKDGVRVPAKILGFVDAKKPVSVFIEKWNDGHGISLIGGSSYTEIKTYQFPKQFLYKRLYPFFGGSYPAPNDMKIKINYL